MNCLFRLVRPSYEDFESRLLKILEFEDEKYLKKYKGKKFLFQTTIFFTHKIINFKNQKFIE